jgi:hypothetical protein
MLLCYFGFAKAVVSRRRSLGYLLLMLLAASPCVAWLMHTEAIGILKASRIKEHRTLAFITLLPSLVGAFGFVCGAFIHGPPLGENVYVGDEVRIFIVKVTFIALFVLGFVPLCILTQT